VRQILSSIQIPPPQHPFPEGQTDLYSVKSLWQQCVQKHLATTIFMQERGDRIIEKVSEAKRVNSDLMSLLASSDAIPPRFLPIAEFSAFALQPAFLDQTDPIVRACVAAAGHSQDDLSQLLDAIKKIKGTREKGGDLEAPEAQIGAMHDLLDGWAQSTRWDPETCSLKVAADPVQFFDFFGHPINSITHPLFAHFQKDQTIEGAKHLVTHIIHQLNVKEPRSQQVLNAIVVAFLGPSFVPEVALDGPGTEDPGLLGLALELVMIQDPNALLALIESKADPQNLISGVQKAADALRVITTSGTEILEFVYQFTIPEYLNERMKAIRGALAQFLRK